jgi:hypothetical protein
MKVERYLNIFENFVLFIVSLTGNYEKLHLIIKCARPHFALSVRA